MSRKLHLRDCNPRWVSHDGVHRTGISFECPEANGGCEGRHVVPTTARPSGGAVWSLSGNLPDVTITPSLACRGACQMHINITNGQIIFHDDSKSGPDWNK